MSTIIADPQPTPLQSLSETLRRDAFYLESSGGTMFCWLHQAFDGTNQGDSARAEQGVVICPPIGFEQLHAHRGLRRLADQLARSGLSTLRLDWHGTGDSPGDDTLVNCSTAWKSNVRDAVRWMKDHLGCTSVSVIGLRLGATLAALSLDEDEIENMVLWAPVVTGRSFVREMTVIDKMSDAPLAETESTSDIEAAGFRLTSETASDLTGLSLMQSHPHCRRVLIAGRDDAPTDSRIASHLAACGIATDERTLSGLVEMLREPHLGQVPEETLREIVDWLVEHTHAPHSANSQDAASPRTISAPTEVTFRSAGNGSTAIRETAIVVSTSPDLFGILSEPVQPTRNRLPTIVLLNAGAAYRIGPGRMNVEMARRFAGAGFRTLRLDLCGLGDSVTIDTADENDSYTPTAFRDIGLALQSLRARFGPQRFVLMGLCSGAYAAFQSAAQFADVDLVESVLINPLTFFWCDGMTLETAPTLDLIREHYYLSSALQPEKWLKLLSGRSHIGMRGALRMVLRRLGLATESSQPVRQTEATCGWHVPAHPVSQDLVRDLRWIAASRRMLTMFFSTTDPGYSILTRQAGRQTRRMRHRGQLDLQFIDRADHTFSRRHARVKLIEAVGQHLQRRYSGSLETQ